MVGRVGHSKDVRRPLVDLFPSVLLHILIVVDVDGAIGVNRDHHLANIGVHLHKHILLIGFTGNSLLSLSIIQLYGT